jgi:murein DD-endopeptidase MepM/ murein hydrolase activator NlpD
MKHTLKSLSVALFVAAGFFIFAGESHAAAHVVRSGEWLSTIAPRYGVSWQSLCSHNGLGNCNSIEVGQVLNIPNGSVSSAPTAPQTVSYGGAVPTGLVMGKPYVYGAAGPYAFDCSGLTQYLARAMGRSISRTSYTQAYDGRPISRWELQPGDLVLMRGNGHVGMAIGNDQLIHAVNPSAGIVIESIDQAIRYNGLSGFRAIGH